MEEPGKKYQIDVTDAYKLLLSGAERLSLGSPALDSALSGESATGKTQLCMQLMLHALLPQKMGGLSGGSYYISTHKSLSEARFEEIKACYLEKYTGVLSGEQVEKGIITAHLTDKDKDELKIYLNDLQKKLEAREPIKLLIIDSITAVCYSFVGEGNKVDRLERASFLLTLVNTLKKLAFQYNLAVIVINNTIGDVEQTGPIPGASSIPALGILWSNSINQRIFLTRKGKADAERGPRRHLEVVFSPSAPPSSVEFTITKAGILGLPAS